MARIKILKNGQTNINSNQIWRFALHSDYKCQKIARFGQASVTVPANSVGGSYWNSVIYHNLGYIPLFWCFVEHRGKGYETVGNYNPEINLEPVDPADPIRAGFDINATSSRLNIETFVLGWGENKYAENFRIRAYFILDEIE